MKRCRRNFPQYLKSKTIKGKAYKNHRENSLKNNIILAFDL